MRVAFVIQRYGPEVDGGSETLCRAVAERLAATCEVQVLTTTAVDYLTWKNELPAGVERRHGVAIRRFPVASPRRVRSFGRLSEKLYRAPHTLEDEIDWMIRQGPRVPALLDHLKRSRDETDAFIFFTYLYYPTWFGLPLVAERSVLVPTLHDEPPARFDLFRSVFHLPRTFVWNTPEERDLARRMFAIDGRGGVAGIGVECPPSVDPERFRRERGLGEFVLYLGRIDVWKGIPEVIELFRRYRTERAPELTLVLAGRSHMKLRAEPGVLPVGFLSEEEKTAALAAASVTLMPSAYESLSVSVLESWSVATPVLANRRSAAVAGQCSRSGGGLTYESYEEFARALDRLRSPEGRALGRAGSDFVSRDCSWERVLGVYRRAIEEAATRSV